MNNRGTLLVRDTMIEQGASLVQSGHLSTLHLLKLAIPPVQLSSHIRVGSSQVAQPDGYGIQAVQLGELVHQRRRYGASERLGKCALDVVFRSQDHTVDEFHNVKRGVADAGVVAVSARSRHGKCGLGERDKDSMLSSHVVCRRQNPADRRPSECPACPLCVAYLVSEI